VAGARKAVGEMQAEAEALRRAAEAEKGAQEQEAKLRDEELAAEGRCAPFRVIQLTPLRPLMISD
jgi:hypothetical protein